jgi:hypothetical protein
VGLERLLERPWNEAHCILCVHLWPLGDDCAGAAACMWAVHLPLA